MKNNNIKNGRVRIGIIGAGARIRRVVRLLMAESEGMEVAAVYDPDPGSQQESRKLWGKDLVVAGSPEELVSREDVDWVMIGSRNCDHADNIIQALHAGCHVFCEKPLATTREDCLRIHKAVLESDRAFAFGLVLRYSPHYRQIKDLLDKGTIGEIISFEFNETLPPDHGGFFFGNWRRSRKWTGSFLLEKCCHDIDLANWLTGSIPVRVASFGGRRFFVPENEGLGERFGKRNGQSIFEQWPDPHRVNAFGPEADIFDHQVAILEYASGIRATFHTNCCTSITERRFYICGTLGTMRADMMTGLIEVRQHGFDLPVECRDSGFRGGHAGGDQLMAKELKQSLLHTRSPVAGMREALGSSLSALAVDEAADSGSVVDLRPLWRDLKIVP